MLAGSLSPALALTLGCGAREQPAPTKVERGTPFDRGAPKAKRDPNDPLRNPATETPRGRDGEQVSEAEIQATLAEAAEFAAVANVAQERNVLRNCANKTPASARCDGRMGLSMIAAKNRRATALYYLVSAATVDEPAADAELYMSVGEHLRTHGRTAAAIESMHKAVDRDPSADNLFILGQTLSLVPERLSEAADRMAEARAINDSIKWLYEEAVIRGQIPVREQAERSIELFNEYLTRAESLPAESLPAPLAPLKGRLAELEELRKHYPTAAEAEQAAAEQAAEQAAEPASPSKVEPS